MIAMSTLVSTLPISSFFACKKRRNFDAKKASGVAQNIATLGVQTSSFFNVRPQNRALPMLSGRSSELGSQAAMLRYFEASVKLFWYNVDPDRGVADGHK